MLSAIWQRTTAWSAAARAGALGGALVWLTFPAVLANAQQPLRKVPSVVPAQLLTAPSERADSEVAPEPSETIDEEISDSANSLQPVPDDGLDDELPKPGAAGFRNVVPGKSTLEEVSGRWGAPQEMTTIDGMVVHLYSMEAFPQIEVAFRDDVVQSIMIRLDMALAARQLSSVLKLSDVRPVLISDEMGMIIGQSFPERGVHFAFEPADGPGKASMMVTHVILEPLTAEAFVLRAETYLDTSPALCERDLKIAIDLDPTGARAHWLLARIYALRGDYEAAIEEGADAVEFDPKEAEYRVSLAQFHGQLDQFTEAMAQAEEAIELAANRPHLQARALCLLGDLLGSGTEPDYTRAFEFHSKAVETAEALVDAQHPAIRLAAKEVLVDANLGAAHDVAWGNWVAKDEAVAAWLEQAAAFAEDLVETEGGSIEYRFRVANRALAAYVGLRGQLDPSPWAKEVIQTGKQLLAAIEDPVQMQQFEWDFGLALYDVVQIHQMRREHDEALRYGEIATEHLKEGLGEESGAKAYLLGRLYFRLGTIHAIGRSNHRAAISWFERALPIFDKTSPHISASEFTRFGQTLVSMGVSYWETEQQERAIMLSEQGVTLIEAAVQKNLAEESALKVPYRNLATMHRKLGEHDKADHFLEMALRLPDSSGNKTR